MGKMKVAQARKLQDDFRPLVVLGEAYSYQRCRRTDSRQDDDTSSISRSLKVQPVKTSMGT